MTRKALLAHLLCEAGERGITTGELLQAGVGSRYSARLMDLRDDGWVVQAERVRDGEWRYRLVSKPARPTPSPRQLRAPEAGAAVALKPPLSPPEDRLFDVPHQPAPAIYGETT